MTVSLGGGLSLPKAAGALARARRMLDDLKNYESDPVGFLDRFPYVLDLLAGVTRMIDRESKGKRTAAFSAWWVSLSILLRDEIKRLRDAELKGLEPQTGRQIDVVITDALAINFPGRPVNDGDTVATFKWIFSQGPLAGHTVLSALGQYLNDLQQVVIEAEERLGCTK